MNTRIKGTALMAVAATSLLLLAGCDDDDDGPREVTFNIRATNLTANQPLSPPALIAHNSDYAAWTVGETAGEGLEMLAEGGNPQPLLDEAADESAVHQVEAMSGLIAPGASLDHELVLEESRGQLLTVATMLVNTNDAFAGDQTSLDGLDVGDSISIYAPSYDAGTEANDEAAANIPGPAGGGEGFNAARETRDTVAGHPGAVTADDGLAGSALNESHRWQNPVLKITISRTE